jgi:hypothetical protein
MTQEQEIIIEEYMAKNDNGQEAMNAMWLAEEMWEQHCAIIRSKDNREFGTYMMAFCMTMMEYIWLPYSTLSGIIEQIRGDYRISYPPENFDIFKNTLHNAWHIQAWYIEADENGNHFESPYTICIKKDAEESLSICTILNHANKAGHDAVTRLSA